MAYLKTGRPTKFISFLTSYFLPLTSNFLLLRLLQNYLSSPNSSIGDMVFKAIRTRFPLRIPAGMTKWRLLQELLLIFLTSNFFLLTTFLSPAHAAVQWSLAVVQG